VAPRGTGWADRGREVVALSAFAVAQPLFDLLGRTPTFFLVRRGGPADVLAVVCAVCVLVPAALFAVEALVGMAGRRARDAAHGVLCALLVAAGALPILLRHGLPADGAGAFAVAAGIGIAATAAGRVRPALRRVVRALAPAMAVFAVLFVAWSPVSGLVLPASVQPHVAGNAAPVPIVMVVFDEFSLTALMSPGRDIDRARFPNFAALARHATWFRQASSVASISEPAIAAIVTGRYPEGRRGEWVSARPRNVFTLLAASHALHVSEAWVPYCPEHLCPDADGERPPRAEHLATLAADTAITFLHVVTPPAYRARLPELSTPLLVGGPDLVNDGFDATDVRREKGQAHYGDRLQRVRQFRAFLEQLGPRSRPTLHYMHVVLPHEPWDRLPSGRYCPTPRPPLRWPDAPRLVGEAYRRHLEQVEYVDRLVGRLIARLKRSGTWGETLLVLVADHGVSFRPGDARRGITATNVCDIISVPLFVKAPGQRRGRIDDRNAETVDVLPTIADAVGLVPPWTVDGRSLLAAPDATRQAKVVAGPYLLPEEAPFFARGHRIRRPPVLQPACLGLAEKHRVVTRGDDGGLVLRVGPYAGLVGRRLDALGPLAPSAGLTLAPPPALNPGVQKIIADLRRRGVIPPPGADPDPATACTAGGVLEVEPGADVPPAVAIVVDGRIRAVAEVPQTAPYEFAAGLPEPAIRDDPDAVQLVAVDGPPAAPALTRLSVSAAARRASTP
jgi:hypothetical protein